VLIPGGEIVFHHFGENIVRYSFGEAAAHLSTPASITAMIMDATKIKSPLEINIIHTNTKENDTKKKKTNSENYY